MISDEAILSSPNGTKGEGEREIDTRSVYFCRAAMLLISRRNEIISQRSSGRGACCTLFSLCRNQRNSLCGIEETAWKTIARRFLASRRGRLSGVFLIKPPRDQPFSVARTTHHARERNSTRAKGISVKPYGRKRTISSARVFSRSCLIMKTHIVGITSRLVPLENNLQT